MGMTDTQISIISHAFWVNAEREQKRRDADMTCEYCGEKQVFDGTCGNCKRRQMRAVTLNVREAGPKAAADVIEWPPGSGQVYKGDQFESAARKFQIACMEKGDMRSYMEYCSQINRGDDVQEFLRR